MLINDFITNIKYHAEKNAFIYQKENKIYYKTYHDVYNDMFKMIQFLEEKGLKPESRLLIFMRPSYGFYILMISALYMSYQIIVIDSFKDLSKVKDMITLSKPDYIIVNKQTKLIKKFIKPFRDIKSLDIAKYSICRSAFREYIYSQNPVLITFTSGSTGNPKKIERTIDNLEEQFRLVSQTFNIKSDQIVLALMPIYVLANLFFGVTSLLYSKKLNQKNTKKLEKLMLLTKTNSINASVSKFLAFKKTMPNIIKCYTGGSLISLADAIRIKQNFPNADFTYVYGASEAVLMAKTNLDEYIRNLEKKEICIGSIVNDVKIRIKNPDNNGIGEICVSGKSVLINEEHATGDLGFIKDNKIYLVGRKKNSLITSEKSYYNYLIEMDILNKIKEVKKCAFLFLNNKKYLVIESKKKYMKKIQQECVSDYKIVIVKKIPVDIRHNYKIDYNKVVMLLDKNS